MTNAAVMDDVLADRTKELSRFAQKRARTYSEIFVEHTNNLKIKKAQGLFKDEELKQYRDFPKAVEEVCTLSFNLLKHLETERGMKDSDVHNCFAELNQIFERYNNLEQIHLRWHSNYNSCYTGIKELNAAEAKLIKRLTRLSKYNTAWLTQIKSRAYEQLQEYGPVLADVFKLGVGIDVVLLKTAKATTDMRECHTILSNTLKVGNRLAVDRHMRLEPA